ncbi:NIPSNAP family protein [Phenylobacterium sp. LjRoot225]|uniref:NIPSNAP family protein n=1 Tax=Phenylobacterium sp. LjRoot225 TaxID=3342285 RepID=UPI003ECF1C55
MLYQLRIYEIFEHNKAAFHARFRDHALRIMKRNGFDIVATWEATTAERTEFVYVARWPNEDLLKSQWASFMADEEWARIKRETAAVNGALVGAIEERLLRATDYSPGQWR